jgi:2-alkyl-3-oxoalkanoate reductase
MTRLAAVTGATGFLGRYIVRALAAQGWRVRILARRSTAHPQLGDLTLETVSGDLSDKRALRELVDGADTIIHAAGLVKAPSSAAFRAVNVSGAANLAIAVASIQQRMRVLVVSSMAAREPQLSAYARTKREGEEVLTRILGNRFDCTIVRSCAIYGPWDRETLAIFRAIGRRVFLWPRVADGRVALIHASDAADAIAGLADRGPSGVILELADKRTQGYSWEEIIATAGEAMGVSTLAIPLPRMAVRAAAALNVAAARVLCRTPMLTPGKAREILHANWGSTAERQPPPELWRPTIDLTRGFRDTVCWYRDRGWLRAAAAGLAAAGPVH